MTFDWIAVGVVQPSRRMASAVSRLSESVPNRAGVSVGGSKCAAGSVRVRDAGLFGVAPFGSVLFAVEMRNRLLRDPGRLTGCGVCRVSWRRHLRVSRRDQLTTKKACDTHARDAVLASLAERIYDDIVRDTRSG